MSKIPLEIVLSGMNIVKKSKRPNHVQIYDQIREMILGKRLLPGDRLPATRDLAKDLGVSRTTIIQGFEQLILEGYLTGKPGSGTYISQDIPDNLINAPEHSEKKNVQENLGSNKKGNLFSFPSKENIIAFQNGTPAFDHFPYKIWQHLGNSVLQNLKSFYLGYSSSLGFWPLRKQIASYLRLSRAVNCDEKQVIIVNGSLQGIYLLSHYLLNKGDRVWMEDPGYEMVKNAFIEREVIITPIPIAEDGINVQYAINHFDNAKLLYVTPSHQYPLGSILSLKKRMLLLEFAAKKKFWIVEDDYDSEFRYDGTPLASLQGLDHNGRVIYSGTFSKVLFPALRIAYLVLPTLQMVEEFKALKDNVIGQPPLTDQIILSQFMEEGHFLRHIRKMRLLYAERRGILVDLIKCYLNEFLTVENQNSGMSVLAWLSDKVDPEKLRKEAVKHKIRVKFLMDFTISNFTRPGIILGYTAFSKYKMKIGIETLLLCFQESLKSSGNDKTFD